MDGKLVWNDQVRSLPPPVAPCPLGRVAEIAVVEQPVSRGWPEWRRFGSFAVVVVARGRGRYLDERGHRRPLVAGDVILVQPSIGHSYHAVGAPWLTGYVVFDGPVFASWAACGQLDDLDPVTQLGRPQRWLRRLHELAARRRRVGPGDGVHALREVDELQRLLTDLLCAARDAQDERPRRVAERLLRTGSWHDPMELVAADCGLSVAGLRRVVRAHWGTSPHRLRMGAVIDRACELMLAGAWSDQQIADELGFADPQHFSKVFKRVRGESPRAYRRRFGHA